jgi:hypothetical protein
MARIFNLFLFFFIRAHTFVTIKGSSVGNDLEILLNNLIEGKHPFSSFLNSADGFATCLDFVNKNINNNGFHVFKI